ncbi:uncharacterized protein [Polyergus mexicanus]|uniref:uncharacterized protein n=1 Tax=Polyergus mexicanus TaxID=615972 RepID=UPI0038B59D15
MTDIPNIGGESIFDDRIVKIEIHTYNPYDLYTLPYESFLYIERKLKISKPDEGFDVVLGNNCVAFMFDEIRYEHDSVEIDCSRNVGITSTLKNYVTISSDRIVRNAGCDTQTNTNGYFNYCVPLYMLFGFCNDYRRVRTTKHSWPIKTATQLEKLRYVVFVLQTGWKNVMSENTSRFDDCKLTNMKLYLNSECYPYGDMNLDFDKTRWWILYHTYHSFCKNYYGYEYLEPSLTVTQFLRNGPFVVIDCS